MIIGAKSGEQLADNLAAVDVKLDAEQLAALDTASRLPLEYPGWMLAQGSAARTALLRTGQVQAQH